MWCEFKAEYAVAGIRLMTITILIKQEEKLFKILPSIKLIKIFSNEDYNDLVVENVLIKIWRKLNFRKH